MFPHKYKGMPACPRMEPKLWKCLSHIQFWERFKSNAWERVPALINSVCHGYGTATWRHLWQACADPIVGATFFMLAGVLYVVESKKVRGNIFIILTFLWIQFESLCQYKWTGENFFFKSQIMFDLLKGFIQIILKNWVLKNLKSVSFL